MKKTFPLLCLLLTLLTAPGGCRVIRIEEEERRPLEYSIVKEEDIPADLTALIEEKKETEFRLTYQSGDTLYLVRGYGRQMSGGYSIRVEELGLSSDAVFFRTELLGPSEPDAAGGEPSYPYIVIETEYRSEPVQFG